MFVRALGRAPHKRGQRAPGASATLFPEAVFAPSNAPVTREQAGHCLPPPLDV